MLSRGARASRRSPPRWRSSGWSATCSRTRRSASAWCRSSRTRPARSAWTRSSRRRRSTTRHGQLYTAVDANLMLAYKESRAGRHPARGHRRGRLGGHLHRRCDQLRHPRRADDPDVHLLFDVRVPADRRRLLGGRRPDGPRLRARRHRRPDHADRRGPAARRRALAPAGRDHAARGGLRPGLRLRDRAHRQGRPAPDVRRRARSTRTARTSSTTSPCTTSRTSSRPSRPTWTSTACSRACTGSSPAAGRATARRGRSCSRPGVGVRWALEAQQLLAEDWDVAADVWSVTSWSELRRDAEAIERARLLDPVGPGHAAT